MWLWQLAKQLRTLPPIIGAQCFICKVAGYRSPAVVRDPGTMYMLCAQCAIDYALRSRKAKRDMEQALRNAKEGAK